ncbi:MAG: HAMP domain-containing histidine kinase, partial [Thermoplasmata archaeon]
KMIEEIMHEYEKEMKDKGIEAIYNGKDVVMYANDFLKEAISNIIWNAIVHSKANRIKVWMESNGDIKIFIEDNGIGISDEIKDRLFEMGVKGEKSKGTGLGLYIAKKIVEEHGGRIEVSNAKDGGTIFKVIIPNK